MVFNAAARRASLPAQRPPLDITGKPIVVKRLDRPGLGKLGRQRVGFLLKLQLPPYVDTLSNL